jgi:hypothetical protein
VTDSDVKNPVGHPSLYREEYCAQVVEYGRQGMSWVEIADQLNVSTKTLRNWRSRYPEFETAMQNAKRSDQAFWERLMRGIALGEVKGNVAAVTKSLQCRFKADWTERTEITGGDGEPFAQQVTRIELVAPDFDRNKEDRDNVIDLEPNRPELPDLGEPCQQYLGESEQVGIGYEEYGIELAAPAPAPAKPDPRPLSVLLQMADLDQHDDMTSSEIRRVANHFAQCHADREAEAIAANEKQKADQQRLRLPANIGAKRTGRN